MTVMRERSHVDVVRLFLPRLLRLPRLAVEDVLHYLVPRLDLV